MNPAAQLPVVGHDEQDVGQPGRRFRAAAGADRVGHEPVEECVARSTTTVPDGQSVGDPNAGQAMLRGAVEDQLDPGRGRDDRSKSTDEGRRGLGRLAAPTHPIEQVRAVDEQPLNAHQRVAQGSLGRAAHAGIVTRSAGIVARRRASAGL